MIPLLLPRMTMFTPSAFQSTLYRIDISLKRATLPLADEAVTQWEQPETPVAETRGSHGHAKPGSGRHRLR